MPGHSPTGDTVVDARDKFLRRAIRPVDDWPETMSRELHARWPAASVPPLIASAWQHHVDQWRRDYPMCQPGAAPWDELWAVFSERPYIRMRQS